VADLTLQLARKEQEVQVCKQEIEKLKIENKQLKEVAEMIDTMIKFAQGNEELMQKKKDLQKKKNALRVEIQRQLSSLKDINDKVNPLDGSYDIYHNNDSARGMSPKSLRARDQLPHED